MLKKIIQKNRHISDLILRTMLAAEATAHYHRDHDRLASERLILELFNSDEKYKDERCLHKYGYKVYSQNEEDGLIARTFDLVGRDTKYFVEFGSGEGLENNSIYLLLNGWTGTWIDGDPERAEFSRRYFERFLKSGDLRSLNQLVTAENVEQIFKESKVPRDLDLLSIDIDGNDFWVWKAIAHYRPRVVVIEYNAGFGPSAEWKMNYNPDHVWRGSRNWGASLKALELLGREKGYTLVGSNLPGSNAFFVRSDLDLTGFLPPFTSERHFQPPRYGLSFYSGFPIDPREIESF